MLHERNNRPAPIEKTTSLKATKKLERAAGVSAAPAPIDRNFLGRLRPNSDTNHRAGWSALI